MDELRFVAFNSILDPIQVDRTDILEHSKQINVPKIVAFKRTHDMRPIKYIYSE